MKRIITAVTTLCLVTTLPGCVKQETVYRSLYDGLQKREQIVRPELGPGADAGTSGFDAYQRERQELLKQQP